MLLQNDEAQDEDPRDERDLEMRWDERDLEQKLSYVTASPTSILDMDNGQTEWSAVDDDDRDDLVTIAQSMILIPCWIYKVEAKPSGVMMMTILKIMKMQW